MKRHHELPRFIASLHAQICVFWNWIERTTEIFHHFKTTRRHFISLRNFDYVCSVLGVQCLVSDHIVMRIMQQTNPVNSDNNFMENSVFFLLVVLSVLFLLWSVCLSFATRNIQSTDILQVRYIMQMVFYTLIWFESKALVSPKLWSAWAWAINEYANTFKSVLESA